MAGCALVGGETAEMPGFYPVDEYDLAGFSVGIVDKDKIINSDSINVGDRVIGIASSGVHSNGFSLVRQILFKDHQLDLDDRPAELLGKSVGEVLLEPTRIYVKAVLPLIKQGLISGVSHITGGGLLENLPRMFEDGLQARLDYASWDKPAIFGYLRDLGELKQAALLETFNLGIGLVLAVAPQNVPAVKDLLQQAAEPFYEIGELVKRPENAAKIEIDF